MRNFELRFALSKNVAQYCYKMTVALQRVSSKEKAPIHRVRVPFRVLVLYGLRFEIESQKQLLTRHSSEYHGESNPVPANPFMEEARAQQQVNFCLFIWSFQYNFSLQIYSTWRRIYWIELRRSEAWMFTELQMAAAWSVLFASTKRATNLEKISSLVSFRDHKNYII